MTSRDKEVLTTDEQQPAGKFETIKIVTHEISSSISSVSGRTVDMGKVITICGGTVDKMSIPYIPRMEAERQRNLIANRGIVMRESTSQ